MSGNIRLPNITGRTVEEQAQQMKSYLTQLAGELNWALDNVVGGSGVSSANTPYRSVNTGAGSDVQQKAEELLKNFNDLKGLIIKSADIVNAYYEEINTRLSGLYVAQSEYGSFVEQTNSVLTQNSTGITQNYSNLQLVVGRVDKAEEDIVSTQEVLTGLIEDTEENLQNTISQTDSNLRDVIAAQDKALRETIDQVDADLQEVVTETENRLAGTVTATETALQNTINQAKQDMLDDIDSAEQRMLENIDGVEQDLNKNITDTRDALNTGINDAKTDLQGNIDGIEKDLGDSIGKTREDLTNSINNTKDALDKNIVDAKEDLEKSIQDAEKKLQEEIDSVTAILIDVKAYIKSGLLYTDDNGIPIYGVEVGQTNVVNGQEIFDQYARFTSDRLSFFDQNGVEVAYISDRKLFISNVEITVSFKLGGFMDKVMADKSVVTKWVGGG